MKNKNISIISLAVASALAFPTLATEAKSPETEITFGGYFKADARFVDGNVPFANGWAGAGTVAEDASRTQHSAQESRFNAKLNHGDVTGFVEIDFVGSAQGNGNVSNSYSPRLRHAYINYKGFTAGQTWSTIVNTSAFPESSNNAGGGALVGEHMVRQTLVRYTHGNFQIALENPNTYGANPLINDGGELIVDEFGNVSVATVSKADDAIPDLIMRYNIDGDWGNVSTSLLVRRLTPIAGEHEVAIGGSIAGRVLVGDKNDIRFTMSHGEMGRYFGTGASYDIYNNQVETTTGGTIAYRHFITDTMRVNAFYGSSKSDVQKVDRSHYGLNVFNNLTDNLMLSLEVGTYKVEDGAHQIYPFNAPIYAPAKDGRSNYAQLSLQYNF